MRVSGSKKSQHGAILAEFAVVLPVLLLILMGVIEFGLLFYNKQVLTNASREGARIGIARLDANGDSNININDISFVVGQYCTNRLITFGAVPVVNTTVSVEGDPYPADYPDELTVTVSYGYTFLVPQLLGLGPNMQLSAETVMNMEKEL